MLHRSLIRIALAATVCSFVGDICAARAADEGGALSEYVCAEDNLHVVVGNEDYLVSENGYLTPTQKNQKPPDLRNFEQTRN